MAVAKMKNKIRDLRLAAGMTQQALAEKSGIPYRTIQNWEEGARKPSDLRKLRKVAVALDCSLDDLLPADTTKDE